MDLWEIIMAIGVPTSFIGFMIWKLQRSIDKREAERCKLELANERNQVLIIKSITITMELAEVTAKALRDGHTNGELEEALKLAGCAKRDQRDFLTAQGVHGFQKGRD